MNKYHIVFTDKVDIDLLQKYNAKNILTFSTLKKIAIADFFDELDTKKLSLEPTIESVEIEKNDVDDTVDTNDSQRESYAIEIHEIKKFHEQGIKGKGVKVAIFDGGCDYHPDLKIAGGYNAYNDDSNYMVDISGHGTHVAGIVGMQDNDFGYLGVAPECELYIVKLNPLDSGGHNRTAQVRGIDWAIRNNIDIINCSFSGSTDSEARREAFRVASEEHDIIIVTSAGNEQRNVPIDRDTMRYPSRYPFVYAVANIDENKKRYISSSVGEQVNFSAGGVNIMSTDLDGGYRSRTGTSMSAPVITGMFALYKEMYPNKSKKELVTLMMENSERLGRKWLYGVGLPIYPKEQKSVQMRELSGGEWVKMNPLTLAKNVQTLQGDTVEEALSFLGGELGSNENGNYMKFNNGLLICWGKTDSLLTSNSPSGNIFRSEESTSWYFPIKFIDENYYVGASTPTTNRWVDSSSGGNTTNIQFRHFSSTPSDREIETRVFAIGRWK